MKFRFVFYLSLIAIIFVGCNSDKKSLPLTKSHSQLMINETKTHKQVIYQVFTRLFGNTNTTNKPWGTIEENGVGKFNDFTDTALKEIKELGTTHIWYTGILHHALINDYTQYGISNDDPDVVKGRAGSPYAVKDYYNVNPDLAANPENRLEEFKALLGRTHKAGLKAIIDIVPNHVARQYEGLTNPHGVVDFGFADDKTITYNINNNFYYNPADAFKVPKATNGYKPLGGEMNVLADGEFNEMPAKWTGNGSRLSQPHFNDWFETVKINYGISPIGVKEFDLLPLGYENKEVAEHYDFWKEKNVPNSWKKFRDIALYWLDMGVDGFRFDMAEMVPVEFWSYLNSNIKHKNTDAFLLAEVYNPALYREYIKKGKMDYLYDKVQLYDTIKSIMQGRGTTDDLPRIERELHDIEHHMVHFLENHDEQRIASPEFAGDAQKAKPAMVVSVTNSSAPSLIYFGQEVGEKAAENAGFGKSSRTSIFDYIGVPSFQRWVNNKNYDGGQLTIEERDLRDFYKRLLNFTSQSPALTGRYYDLHEYNRIHSNNYNAKLFSFARFSENEKLIIVSNFDSKNGYTFQLQIPMDLLGEWNYDGNSISVEDQLYHNFRSEIKIENGVGQLPIQLKPLESFILKF